MAGEPIPEFLGARMLKVPIVIDFVADPPFYVYRALDREKQMKLTNLRIDAVQKLHKAQLAFLQQATEIQQGYLTELSKILG